MAEHVHVCCLILKHSLASIGKFIGAMGSISCVPSGDELSWKINAHFHCNKSLVKLFESGIIRKWMTAVLVVFGHQFEAF